MLLSPGCVIDFDNHGFNCLAVIGEAIVEADGTKPIAEIGKIGKQANWTGRSSAQLLSNKIAYILLEVTIPHMSIALKGRQR